MKNETRTDPGPELRGAGGVGVGRWRGRRA